MRIGFAALTAAYVLSQFYRAFLAVLTPDLEADLGVSKVALADASGLWFLGFALAQLPIGYGLDRIGPRQTSAWLLGLCGGGGALLFAAAGGETAIKYSMILIGIGCGPVLMASFYIFARLYPPAVFGSMAALVVGVGSVGNLGAALPLSLAVEAFGWRGTMYALASVTVAVALAVFFFVTDPPRAETPKGAGSFWQTIRQPGVWAIFVMLATSYVGAAAVRGLWAAPYFKDVFDAGMTEIGMITLAMGGAMIAGTLAYGPSDRLFGTRKWVNVIGNAAGAACMIVLWLMPQPAYWVALLAIVGIGFFGSTYSMLMAHGRAFFPAHQVGRGVTLLNLFSIGGVGVFQIGSGRVFEAAGPQILPAYSALFGYFAGVVILGCVVYGLWSKDRLD